jgi:hypothetical protein
MGTDVVKNVNKNNASHAVLFEALALVGLYCLFGRLLFIFLAICLIFSCPTSFFLVHIFVSPIGSCVLKNHHAILLIITGYAS